MKSEAAENKTRCLTFKVLSKVEGLAHGVFTRHGGVSAPPYESLNASWGNGDCPGAVAENLSRIKGSLGLEMLVSSRQVHGDAINLVDEGVLSGGQIHPALALMSPGDALATKVSGVGLVIKVADCQSIFLVDPETRAIANVHSGWRGSVQNIAAKAVGYIRDRFGCDPAKILAAVGPSLGPCCAEFKNFRDEIPPDLWSFQVRPEYFDFWAITRSQLASAGIRDENMEFARRCTACQTEDFFSYRAERTTGRMAAVIGWKRQNPPPPFSSGEGRENRGA